MNRTQTQTQTRTRTQTLLALAVLATRLAFAAGLENEYVAITFGEKGEIASIKDKASGRELVKTVLPFAEVTLNDGKTKLVPEQFAQRGDRLGWFFRGGGEFELSVKPFAGGWTFASERFTVRDAETCEYFRFVPACNRYKGGYAHMLSDDEDAVCVRSYDTKLRMVSPGGFWGTKWGCYKPVMAHADWGFTGHRCGLSAGARGQIRKMLRNMALESGQPFSTCGGPWCLGADENRCSYVFSYYDGHHFDEWLNMLDVTGIGTMHFHLWYSASGNYTLVNPNKFPKGLAGLKEAADRVHAAGHRVSLHTLSALIAGPNPWVATDRNDGLLSVFRYTTLNDLREGVTELLVRERPNDDMDTSVTYGSLGNYLRLGHEIVQYAGIRREKPYAFTGITRGSHGTKVVDHPAGETAHYLRARYYGLYPDADGPVMDEIADAFATVVNTVKADRVFLDGAEGIGPRYGKDGEYQIATMINKMFSKLDQSAHPIQAEVSCFNTYTWWMRANAGAVDGAHYGRKIFDRDHIRDAATHRKANLLEPQCGWWAPGQVTDETDYYMSHVVGVDGAMSLYGWVNAINRGPLGMHGQSELTVLGWYEHFRMAMAFNDQALAKYRDLDSESRLRQDARGVWQVEPYDCLDHRIDHAAKRQWIVERPTAGAVEPVVYVLGGSAPYGDPSAIAIASGADAAKMRVKSSAKSVETRVSAAEEKGRGRCIKLTAVNRGKTAAKTWAQAELTFAKPRDCAPSDGVGFWVKGDGSGAMLNVCVSGGGPQDCLVRLDFAGWRYFEFLYSERDCATWSKCKWPIGGGWGQFSCDFNPKSVTAVNVMLAEIPVEGEKNVFLDANADAAMAAHEGVEVVVSEIRALPKRTYAFTDVTLAVNGRKYALPFDTVESNDRIFLRDGFWVLRDALGELKRKVKTADEISLKAGANHLSLTADAIEGELRADVKLLAFGSAFPALRPTADWPAKWARHGMYEAMLPIEYCPRKGATELPSLTIRPGERAAIEVHLIGEVKGPWLACGTQDGANRLALPDGRIGERVKFQGPVLSGAWPLRFGCADPDNADVRIEIVKRYTDAPAADASPAAARTRDIVLVAPREGEVVSLVNDDLRAYFAKPRIERERLFTNATYRTEMARWAFVDKPVRLRWLWRGHYNPMLTVEVFAPDGRRVFSERTAAPEIDVPNLEIGRRYRWRVSGHPALRAEPIEGSFVTADDAPRALRFPHVYNLRDLGGRIGLGGRRVKQGLVYRSGGLNDNAITFDRPASDWIPGEVRMTAGERAAFLAFTGIRTDLDLRNGRECFGMTGSPLGPSVKWTECSSWAYGELGERKGKDAFAKVFRVFLDSANYPIDFHCITGADRTGTVAFILNALLGVGLEDLYRDWEATALYSTRMDFHHARRLDTFVAVVASYPGATLAEKTAAFVRDCGFADADIAFVREFLLEK